MKKYFCDRCKKEKEHDNNYLFNCFNGHLEMSDFDLCQKCAKELEDIMDKFCGIMKCKDPENMDCDCELCKQVKEKEKCKESAQNEPTEEEIVKNEIKALLDKDYVKSKQDEGGKE